jgi:hypothetical protein
MASQLGALLSVFTPAESTDPSMTNAFALLSRGLGHVCRFRNEPVASNVIAQSKSTLGPQSLNRMTPEQYLQEHSDPATLGFLKSSMGCEFATVKFDSQGLEDISKTEHRNGKRVQRRWTQTQTQTVRQRLSLKTAASKKRSRRPNGEAHAQREMAKATKTTTLITIQSKKQRVSRGRPVSRSASKTLRMRAAWLAPNSWPLKFRAVIDI